ncbi:uncharacterized protein DS421_12g388220 [Arachis hypogaea]|nr:uncharacterized protein DS421_12g388220 [Arachis hypogaea]
MAKGIRNLSCWMEVAPAPVIFPTKPSNSPRLETIAEEEAAEGYDRHQNKKKMLKNWMMILMKNWSTLCKLAQRRMDGVPLPQQSTLEFLSLSSCGVQIKILF